MEEYVKAMLGKIDTSLIAKITKVHGNGFVDVEPMAEFQDVKLPPILHVPMCQLGNKEINFKVKFKVGDVVPILILSRDASGYITKERTTANTNKRHNLTNAIALPFYIPTDVNPDTEPSSIEINGNIKMEGDIKTGNIESGEVKAKTVDTESGTSKGGVPYIHP
nr:MAG TPA: baseplate protein [Caudoviricetes sp.]